MIFRGDPDHGTTVPAEVLSWARAASRITVLTGAGMSTESGVPTFRDAQTGLWARFDPAELATADAYLGDPAMVWAWYLWRMALIRQAQPNEGHRALHRLSKLKQLVVVTQNVDDLHERAVPAGGVLEVTHVHGSIFASRCFVCGKPHAQPPELSPVDQPLASVPPPRCRHCGGLIRPGVVWFGESLPMPAWHRAEDRVRGCDLLLVVGTSGLVAPASGLPGLATRHRRKVAEINPVETALSSSVDFSWRTTAAVGLPALVDALAGS